MPPVGVSPVGTKRKYPLFLDESARAHERIAVSAGVRGCQMLLAPGDLLAVTRGRYAGITSPRNSFLGEESSFRLPKVSTVTEAFYPFIFSATHLT